MFIVYKKSPESLVNYCLVCLGPLVFRQLKNFKEKSEKKFPFFKNFFYLCVNNNEGIWKSSI